MQLFIFKLDLIATYHQIMISPDDIEISPPLRKRDIELSFYARGNMLCIHLFSYGLCKKKSGPKDLVVVIYADNFHFVVRT